MASLIPGYEYDIFISYRQKDNKYDGWVTEFVDHLKRELEATFKEEISLYFDINPHDGLLETHDVDESLKGKLKCLVFIPIISRTYCDPKSFAWGHEFKSFVEQASQDKFGLKVKLPNGNVASRVLPVRIYDLDSADIKLCESVISGVLRGVEFIYKEPGVNRPLTPLEDEKKNLNKTKYRNQINKVANAVKEIVSGLMIGEVVLEKDKPVSQLPWEEIKNGKKIIDQEKPAGSRKREMLLGVLSIIILVSLVAIYIYPKIFKRYIPESHRASGKISVVVMPFLNMTGDTTLQNWQDGIQYNIISYLSNFTQDLTVRQRESVTNILQSKGLTDYISITTSIARSISEKLDADVLINGGINKSGSRIRLNAQLVDPKTEEVFKALHVDGTRENIFPLIDSLSVMVKNILVISKLEKELSPEFLHIASVNFPEAFRCFKSGQDAFNERNWPTAAKFYSQAIAIDSNLIYAYVMLCYSYLNQEMYDKSKQLCLHIYKRKNQMSIPDKFLPEYLYAVLFETPYEEIKYLRQGLGFDDQLPAFHFVLGLAYFKLHQLNDAIPEYEKALEIYDKWDVKPGWTGNYSHLGIIYHMTGQFKKEKDLYKKAEKHFPDNSDLMSEHAILLLSEGDTIKANPYIDKFISICKEQSISEDSIMIRIAGVYSDANMLDKAEALYSKALLSEPENPDWLNTLAYFLIDKDRNVHEGMELIENALKISPDSYYLLHTKGWGLYKLKKYREALNILQKSWDLRRKLAVYDHTAFLHLQAAKKAVEGLK